MTETVTAPTSTAPQPPSATSTTDPSTYSLDDSAEVVTRPPAHYIYVEQRGPCSSVARPCWIALCDHLAAIRSHNTITQHATLYCVATDPQRSVYRAGVFVAAEPTAALPAGLQSTLYGGGKYARYMVTGSLTHLPEASGRVYASVEEKGLAWRREEFSVESCLNNPSTTPADELQTEILVPIA